MASRETVQAEDSKDRSSLRRAEAHLGRRLMLLTGLILAVAYILAHTVVDFDPLLLSDQDAKSAGILTAHPDDEVMFFTPTILALLAGGWDVRALCLSNGNGDGLGEIRSEELVNSYERLGIAKDRVTLVDDPYLQDGMQKHWASSHVSHILDQHLSAHPASVVITFDPVGITQHPNHIALAHGCSFGPSKTTRNCFALQSPSLLFKFTGPIWAISQNLKSQALHALGISTPQRGVKRRLAVTNDVAGWIKGAKAMMEHRSQLVWFRYLYFAFSRLVWHNELEELLEHG